MSRPCRRFLRSVALLVAVMSAGCAHEALVALNETRPCPEKMEAISCSDYDHRRDGTNPNQRGDIVEVCVVFDEQGCIDHEDLTLPDGSTKHYPHVRPDIVGVCPNESLRWVAVRKREDGEFVVIDKRFRVLFTPLSRFLGIKLPGETFQSQHVRGIYRGVDNDAAFQYTLEAPTACEPRYLDPRIRIDPQ